MTCVAIFLLITTAILKIDKYTKSSKCAETKRTFKLLFDNIPFGEAKEVQIDF